MGCAPGVYGGEAVGASFGTLRYEPPAHLLITGKIRNVRAMGTKGLLKREIRSPDKLAEKAIAIHQKAGKTDRFACWRDKILLGN